MVRGALAIWSYYLTCLGKFSKGILMCQHTMLDNLLLPNPSTVGDHRHHVGKFPPSPYEGNVRRVVAGLGHLDRRGPQKCAPSLVFRIP